MRKIAVVTGTRAEYGVLRNTIKKIQADEELELQLIVTGTHLSERFGYTVDEIKKDGFNICEEISIILDGSGSDGAAKAMGLLTLNLSQAFSRLKPDLLLILGDRYEILAAVTTALAMNIPVAHISGGEITEGAMDEQIRHSITKMSHIHFPGTEEYGENIRKMGEESWRIFNVGDPGIENIKLNEFLNGEQLREDLGIDIDKNTLLVTFHPVTLELKDLPTQTDNLLYALGQLKNNMVITYPNSDNGGQYIIDRLVRFAENRKNICLVKSLGIRRYLSVMKLSGAVVGNSSSALIEAPFLKVPTVNIGNRQKGRLMAKSIIQCGYRSEEILSAVNQALSDDFKRVAESSESLYGEGNTSTEIVNILKNIELGEKLLKKRLVWKR